MSNQAASAQQRLPLLGAILAGGMSTRMGTPKSRLKLHGRRVIDVLADHLRPFCAKTVIICRDQEQAAKLTPHPGTTLLYDASPNLGPMGGLITAFAHSRYDAVLLLGCDVPFIQVQLLEKLSANFERDQPIALLPRTPGPDGPQPQPLCSIWSLRAAPHVQAAVREPHRSLFRLAARIGAAYLDLNGEESKQLRNVNTRADLVDGLSFEDQ